ncbi:hypothetical protein [Cerasicoccus fimbriatus]|uniref:hypothetical protein n=1 Tax=Cerasicoccus fimbriatus TaxID=3014554 RepID=UPI0022B40CCF|nr:hypothetical protein [Cerasicoccus sp. TK19100]
MWEIYSVPWHGKVGFLLIAFATLALTAISLKQRIYPIPCPNRKAQFRILIGINAIWATFLTIEKIGHTLLRNLQANSEPMTKLYYTLESFIEVSAPIAMGLIVWAMILVCLFILSFAGRPNKGKDEPDEAGDDSHRTYS